MLFLRSNNLSLSQDFKGEFKSPLIHYGISYWSNQNNKYIEYYII